MLIEATTDFCYEEQHAAVILFHDSVVSCCFFLGGRRSNSSSNLREMDGDVATVEGNYPPVFGEVGGDFPDAEPVPRHGTLFDISKAVNSHH